MPENLLDTLIMSWSKKNYIEPILLLSMIYSIISLAINKLNLRLKSIFLFGLSLHALGFTLIQFFPFLFSERTIISKKQTILVINNFIIIIEYFLFAYFYYNSIKSLLFKKLLTITGLFIVISIFFIQINSFKNFNYSTDKASFIVNSIEFIMILIVCLRYFFETTQSNSQINLFFISEFRISSAILLYISSSLPYITCGNYLFTTNLSIYKILSAIHYTSLCALFLIISKSFNPNTQTQI